jgi:hypothetical protein
VGKANTVEVAEGGNQTIVSVGSGLSVGKGVWVGGIEFNGRQAIKRKSPQARKQIRKALIE